MICQLAWTERHLTQKSMELEPGSDLLMNVKYNLSKMAVPQ